MRPRAFKLSLLDGCFRLKSAIAQLKDVVEAVKNHFVVRDDDDRGTLLDGDPAQQIHDDSGACRIERCGRLVGEDDARPVGKRARDRDALGFAAGELRRQGMLAVADFEIVEQFDARAARGGWRRIPQDRARRRHCRCRQKRQQVGVLEDEADLLEPQPAQVGLQPAAVIDTSPSSVMRPPTARGCSRCS